MSRVNSHAVANDLKKHDDHRFSTPESPSIRLQIFGTLSSRPPSPAKMWGRKFLVQNKKGVSTGGNLSLSLSLYILHYVHILQMVIKLGWSPHSQVASRPG